MGNEKEVNLSNATRQNLTEAEYFSILANWSKNYINVEDYHYATETGFTLYVRNFVTNSLLVMDKYHKLNLTDYYIYLDIIS